MIVKQKECLLRNNNKKTQNILHIKFIFEKQIYFYFPILLAASQRMWSLQQLHSLLVTGYNDGEAVTHHLHELKAPDSALGNLLQELPQALLRQYEYEDISVRSGLHLMHSDFFKVSIRGLATSFVL